MSHEPQVHTKQGLEWTNDLGQTFPAQPLYRFGCSCGWAGAAWYASAGRAQSHYERHLESVERSSELDIGAAR